MSKEETYYIIASGGYLKEMQIEKVVISEDDKEMEEFDSYEEYKEYFFEEECAAYEQRFAKAIIISQKEANELSGLLNALEGPRGS